MGCSEADKLRPTLTKGILPSPHTKFQLPSSIWWGDRGGTPLFQDQVGKPFISSLHIYLRVDFLDKMYNFFSQKETIFAFLSP